MRNVKLGRQVLDYVVAHPAEFNMNMFGTKEAFYPCRTVACLAGHTLLFSGWTLDQRGDFRDPEGNSQYALAAAAIDLLGLTDEEYVGQEYDLCLFAGGQSNSEAIERFRVIVEKSEAET